MKQTLKATAAVIGMIAAGALISSALYLILWACYYAGMSM